MKHLFTLISILLLSSPLFGQSKETCYVSIEGSKELNLNLFSQISKSLISQYFKPVKNIPPGGIRSDSCVYEITVTKEGDTTFVVFSGEDLNSYGDSKLYGSDGFQQSLLKSLYRSLRDKRKLICEDYGELIEKCGSVVVQDVPKQVEPKVVKKKVTIPKVEPKVVETPIVEPKVVVIPKKVAKRKSDMPSLKKLLDTKKCPNCDLSEANLKDADLRGANLNGADLKGANLNGADLTVANLKGVYLNGANLSNANLTDAILSDAILIRANLSKANLKDAYLYRANLSKANLKGANLGNAYLSNADLRGANLKDANLVEANLNGADLNKAVFGGTKMNQSKYLKMQGVIEFEEVAKKKVQESVVQKTDQMVLYGKLVKDKRNPSKSVTKWFSYGNDKTDQKYVGETKNGFPNGKGTHTLPNGDKYIGEFWNGKRHGQGTIFWINGNEVVGEFQNNEYLDVIIYDSNGDEISRIVK